MKRLAALAVVATFAFVACSTSRSTDRSERTGGEAPRSTTATTAADTAAPLVPTSSAVLATELVAAERGIREHAGTPRALRFARRQQQAYRALGAHPEWLPDVLAQAPPDLHAAISGNELAGRSLSGLGEPQPALPAWQVVAPPAPDVLRSLYAEAEALSGIQWAYLAAIHLIETRLGRIRGTSVAGAQGPMQFIPETWAVYGEGDINDNRDAILAAARFLQAMGGPADMRRALFRYNPSDRYVDAVDAHAQIMLTDERAFLGGYYHWQVYYATVDGPFVLPEGYPQVPARRAQVAR